MAVNLSPIGGVAGQFFDNNGDPLTGGKIYTYAAGTTTPSPTYTTSVGGTPHANPIILDAAGRVPGGEIWLTDGAQYKFVIKTSTDVQIGSYDNIIGINSNFVNYTNSQEIQTATAGQTVFTLTTMQYQPGTNSLSVFVDGVNQYGPGALYAYDETSSTVVTFSSGLHVGAKVKFVTSAINASSYGDAAQISFTGFKSQPGNVQDLADADGSNWIGFQPAGTSAVAMSAQDKLREIVSVKDFGAVGDGVADDTAAINAAIAYVGTLPYGGAVFFPVGTYAVTEINAAVFDGGAFNKTLRLYGVGREMSRIVPFSTNTVLLNLMGTNQAQVDNLHFDSGAYVPQCAIFLARTTVSTNCNNNKFYNLFFSGSYSRATVVCNGSESSNWYNCRFENNNVAANHSCFWTGGGSLVGPLQSITTVNGGTVLNINNPNTDNKMFGCEFYAPFNSAYPVRFSTAASYTFTGCTIVAGTVNDARLVTYGDTTGGRFNGPITWLSCHFEVFGTNNVVHYLSPVANTTFDGISNYGGYYVLTDGTPIIDFDRTNPVFQPQLQSSVWTNFTTAPNSVNTKAYVYTLLSCNISFTPNPSDGYFYVFGYVQRSTFFAAFPFVGSTRFLDCIHTVTAPALPTTGTYTVGTTIQRETPVVGQPVGWKCTVSGTLGTLNGGATTGTINAGSNVLTVNSATGLQEGQRITVAGAGGPFYVRKLSGTTVYLDANASASVSGVAVGFSNATLVALPNL